MRVLKGQLGALPLRLPFGERVGRRKCFLMRACGFGAEPVPRIHDLLTVVP
jgi:hypothetical protein